MRNFVQPGKTLTLTAPYARSAGEGALVGAIFGVACNDVLNAAETEFETEGVFTLTKVGSQGWAIGDKIYWDNGNKRCTTDSAAGQLIGVATAVVGSGVGDTTGAVRLNGSAPSGLEGPQAAIASLTDNSGGTAADGTIAAIAATAGACAGGASPSAANVDTAIATAVATIVSGVNDANKELATKVNAILVALRTVGIIAP